MPYHHLFKMGENETKIDFVLKKKEDRQNVKAAPWDFQHALVIEDIEKRKIRKVVRKEGVERTKITVLKDVKIRKLFEEKVTELVDVGATNMWRDF